MSEPARVLVADPPWSFGDKLPGNGRGAEKHYRVLDQAGIEAFSLPPMADDSLLFLWRVSSQPEEACRVIRAWGFVPKSEIVWEKLTKNDKPHFGMGRYVRLSHEICMIAVRGKGMQLIRDHSVRSVFAARVGRHSEKPEAFFDLVERLATGPYVELFARRRRPGWECFGDEIGGEQ
jgi:N6-adenosine-specific RNA methylase IME4